MNLDIQQLESLFSYFPAENEAVREQRLFLTEFLADMKKETDFKEKSVTWQEEVPLTFTATEISENAYDNDLIGEVVDECMERLATPTQNLDFQKAIDETQAIFTFIVNEGGEIPSKDWDNFMTLKNDEDMGQIEFRKLLIKQAEDRPTDMVRLLDREYTRRMNEKFTALTLQKLERFNQLVDVEQLDENTGFYYIHPFTATDLAVIEQERSELLGIASYLKNHGFLPYLQLEIELQVAEGMAEVY